ncbi:MAG: arylsulfotransferase family protein, partial [Kiloniellales bacterium]
MLRHLDKVLFALALGVLVFAYGVAVGKYDLFPYEMLNKSADAASDLYRNWKSYALIEPTKYLHPARQPGAGVTIYDPERAYAGLTFMTGLFDREVALQIVDMQGAVVHRWIPDLDRISGGVDGELPAGSEYPFNKWDTEVHGAWVLRDGSVVFNYFATLLVKLDKCGNPLWIRPYVTHHSVFRSEDGSFWMSKRSYVAEGGPTPPMIVPPFKQESALQVSPDGEILREIPLARLLIDNGMEGLLFPTGTASVRNPHDDFLHLNDVEVLQSADAASFPMFEAGDVMVSLRHLNLVFVFDPDTLRIKWHQTGPWLQQHDPDFLPDGTISIFNNRRDHTRTGSVLGGSNITVVDPASHETRIAYEGSPEKPFYTDEMGKHQLLPNGNILIAESYGGRAFEVDEKGEIVWEHINRVDDTHIAEFQEATR